MVITFCNLTKSYVSLRYCELLDPACVYRHGKTWYKREILEGDAERPSDDIHIIRKPTVCFRGKKLHFRYSPPLIL